MGYTDACRKTERWLNESRFGYAEPQASRWLHHHWLWGDVINTSWNQNDNPQNGEIWIANQRKSSSHSNRQWKWCTLSFGTDKNVIILDFLKPRQMINFDCYIAMLSWSHKFQTREEENLSPVKKKIMSSHIIMMKMGLYGYSFSDNNFCEKVGHHCRSFWICIFISDSVHCIVNKNAYTVLVSLENSILKMKTYSL